MLTELQTDMVLPLGKYIIRLACIFFDSTVSPLIPTDTKKFIFLSSGDYPSVFDVIISQASC